jgi:uncharacterized protein (DUF4213/DUF364 family)
MVILNEILEQLPVGDIEQVCIGLRWTGVVVRVNGERRCGLSSTLGGDRTHDGLPPVPQAGRLTELSAHNLAAMALERDHPTLASVGVATINALLPDPDLDRCVDGNADELLLKMGARKKVAIVGHFPFVPRVREVADELFVLEREPHGEDHPATMAPQILPRCDVVAITGMTLTNHSMEELLEYCEEDAIVMILGPSTPFCSVLFDAGAQLLSGSMITDIDAVMRAVSQGAKFPQIHAVGIELVNLARSVESAEAFATLLRG